MILLDECQRQVDAGGHARRGVRGAVTNIYRIRFDPAGRAPGGEFLRDLPVCGRTLAVQETGGAEDECSGADGRDPVGPERQGPRGLDQLTGDRAARVEVRAATRKVSGADCEAAASTAIRIPTDEVTSVPVGDASTTW